MNVFLGFPTYDMRIEAGAAKGVFCTASQLHVPFVCCQGNSLLAHNFNLMWAESLNLREKEGFKWFAMLHSDVEPSQWWLDKLIAEADRVNADMLSVVIPIKSKRGVTSTAIAKPGTRFDNFCRLTTSQIRHPLFPQTFGINEAADALEQLPNQFRMKDVPREALLVNTGCFICRLDQPWSDQVWFEINDRIVKVNDEYVAEVEPEDWNFSRQLEAKGARVMATSIVGVNHHGVASYVSTQPWGVLKDTAKGHA